MNLEHVLSMVEPRWRIIIGTPVFLPDLLNRQYLVRLLQVYVNHLTVCLLDLLSQVKLIILILADLDRLLCLVRVN